MKKDKEKYESPETRRTQVNLENGFMTASIFEEENQKDDGVTIEGHEEGNTGDYSGLGWDNSGDTQRTWNN